MRLFFCRAASVLAVLYLAALVIVALLFRFVGEKWWVTSVTLYVPRAPFLIPLPLIVLALALCKRWRLLLTQLAAAFVALFLLMGLVLPWPARRDPGSPSVRLLSFNVNSGYGGYDKVLEAVRSFSPDVVLLQEMGWDGEGVVAKLRSEYAATQPSTQFIIASRFPIESTLEPDKLPFDGRLRSPRFVQYVLKTPLGPISLYNVHPISPRSGFYAVRAGGLRHQILSGKLFLGEEAPVVQANSGLRTMQIEKVAELAARETNPVVIAGDTNLPGLSPVLHQYLGRYQDGFREAGSGFGYTFPSRYPWMRIDRILASRELRFVRFEVGCPGVSDHLCIVADIERRRD